MVSEHREAARLFQQESERGQVTSLKELASRLLPTVQQHAEPGQRRQPAQVGVEVTTTTAEARQGSSRASPAVSCPRGGTSPATT